MAVIKHTFTAIVSGTGEGTGTPCHAPTPREDHPVGGEGAVQGTLSSVYVALTLAEVGETDGREEKLHKIHCQTALLVNHRTLCGLGDKFTLLMRGARNKKNQACMRAHLTNKTHEK